MRFPVISPYCIITLFHISHSIWLNKQTNTQLQFPSSCEMERDDNNIETVVVMASTPQLSSIHLTLGFKSACTREEVVELLLDADNTMKKLLPIQCRLGEERKVGPNEDMDAYSVQFDDEESKEVLDKFWHRHQRRDEGERMFPFTPHITLNSDEKRKECDALKRTENGEFQLNNVVLRTLRDKRVLGRVESKK